MTLTESDIPRWDKSLHAPVTGTVRRDGMRVLPTSSSRDDGHERHTEGTVRYAPVTEALPRSTDLQGWHAWRGNTHVMTFPAGTAVPLGTALARMEAATL